MNYNKLNSLTRKFLVNEASSPDVHGYLQALGETLSKFRPKTKTENRRLEMARSQLKEVKRHVRRIEEKVTLLEEKLRILEENINE
tara:strand:+ start:348 stop:605 length:258 start_codon:yes stop_codon:yes gene_type:complete